MWKLFSILTLVVDIQTYKVITLYGPPPTPQTHTSTSKTGDIKIRSADYINVSMVVYYSFAKCYHWGKLDRVYSVLFLTCESIIISVKTSVTKNKLVLAP